MRIAQIHNAYQLAGGEDRVVERERALLAERGHDVRLYSISNDEIVGTSAKVRTLLTTPYSRASRAHLLTWLQAERPDVAHVHNFFPLISPSVYDACAEAGVPVVQTLHNYRTLCAGALLLRNGTYCEACVGRLPIRGVIHRCYRGSVPGSAAVAAMILGYRRQRHKVQRFIVLSEAARAVFVRSGLPEGRMVLKPNFVRDDGPPPQAERMGGLFVGRLSTEKGAGPLIKAWQGVDAPLEVAGTGPLETELRAIASPQVTFRGQLTPADVRAAMLQSAFLVAPSLATEQFPLSLAEAFSCGLPVIASRWDALAEIVTEGETGLLVRPNDAVDLRNKILWALAHPEEMTRMGRAARARFEARYSDGSNYEMLMRIYAEAKEELHRDRS